MSNALKLAETEQGMHSAYWDYTGDAKTDFEKYFGQYISCDWRNIYFDWDYSSNNGYKIAEEGTYPVCVLNDGTFVAVRNHSTPGMDLVFDYNGDKGKNKPGVDQFWFQIGRTGPGDFIDNDSSLCKGVVPLDLDECWGANEGGSREYLYSNCHGSGNSGYLCSSLLQADGWEFKDDYPFRL